MKYKLYSSAAALGAAAAMLLSAVDMIPASAAEIGETFTDNVLTYAYVDGGVSIVGCEKSATSITIRDNISGYPILSIGESAFADCTKLTQIQFDEGIREIGDGAFTNCTGLTSVVLPDSVTSLGDAVFYSCSALTELELPDHLTELGAYTFAYCIGLKEVTLPSGLERLPGYCFYYNLSLSKVTLPENLQAIENFAFVGCYELTELNIPAAVKEIAPLSVLACAKLEAISVDEENTTYMSTEDGVLMDTKQSTLLLYPGGNPAERYTVPESVTEISYYAMSGAIHLKEIVLHDALTTIREGAFSDCLALETISLPKTITVIDNSVFADCTALQSFTIPDTITAIGEYAFYHCTALTDITIPASVASIGAYAFSDCSALKEIHVPTTVAKIGDYAFGYLAADTESDSDADADSKLVLQKDFVMHGHSRSAAKTYARKFDVKFRQTNFPIALVMGCVSGVLVIAAVVVFVLDHKKRKKLMPAAADAVDENKITDPAAIQDANYSSILGDSDEGDPFDRSYGFIIEEEDDAESLNTEPKADAEDAVDVSAEDEEQ